MKKVLCFLIVVQTSYLAIGQVVENENDKYPPLTTFTAEEDHQDMMEQLGIQKLRPGPSGNESAPNHANYDESKANPCPQLPDVLTAKNGQMVSSPEMWWNRRRPEIVEDTEREMYGRLPDNIPDVSWEVKITDHEYVGRIPVIAKQLIGRVDNVPDMARASGFCLYLLKLADLGICFK